MLSLHRFWARLQPPSIKETCLIGFSRLLRLLKIESAFENETIHRLRMPSDAAPLAGGFIWVISNGACPVFADLTVLVTVVVVLEYGLSVPVFPFPSFL